MAVDNSEFIAPFAPPVENGDSFIYTELIDRTKQKGNNGHRILKTFFHRSRDEFWEQLPNIKLICDMLKIRAYTRLSRKSFEKVGRSYTKMVVEAAMSNNWAGMKTLYHRALATTPADEKYWIFDIDAINERTKEFGDRLWAAGHMVMDLPSRKGRHYIAKPFNTQIIEAWYAELGMKTTQGEEEISLHKDNPTNLYIPDGAD